MLYRYPGTGEYDKFFNEGIYTCAGCGTPLYKSTTKFNSGCGWPAFFEGLPGAINRHVSSPYIFFFCNSFFSSINRVHIGIRLSYECLSCGLRRTQMEGGLK